MRQTMVKMAIQTLLLSDYKYLVAIPPSLSGSRARSLFLMLHSSSWVYGTPRSNNEMAYDMQSIKYFTCRSFLVSVCVCVSELNVLAKQQVMLWSVYILANLAIHIFPHFGCVFAHSYRAKTAHWAWALRHLGARARAHSDLIWLRQAIRLVSCLAHFVHLKLCTNMSMRCWFNCDTISRHK